MNIMQCSHTTKTIQQYKVNYNSWPVEWLANYIEKLQRKTITEKSKAVLRNIKLIKDCVGRYNDFTKTEQLFEASLCRLSAHMIKEEQYLFPFVREMVHAKELKHCINRFTLDKIGCLIEVLNDEHAVERSQSKLSAEVSSNLIPGKPANILLAEIVEFEQVCELHIYLQCKFLFPKILSAKYASN